MVEPSRQTFFTCSKFPLHAREINIQPLELLLSFQLYAAKKILTDFL